MHYSICTYSHMCLMHTGISQVAVFHWDCSPSVAMVTISGACGTVAVLLQCVLVGAHFDPVFAPSVHRFQRSKLGKMGNPMDVYESAFTVTNPLIGADGYRSNSPTVS